MKLDEIQAQLREQQLDGWLLFDHHRRDPLAYRVLGLNPKQHVTRRWYCFIPAHGHPQKLVHRIESKMLDQVPGKTNVYSSWEEQTRAVHDMLRGSRKVAMQYSPNCAIPYVSNVDGGTIDLIRSSGVEVVTSAELIQYFEARLNQRGLELHLEAGQRVDRVRAEAFQWIGDAVRGREPRTEWDVAEFVRNRFAEQGLITESGPIVGVDAHAGDPHYEPQKESSSPIREGSFVLLDMWAKLDEPEAVYYDITWTAFCGPVPPHDVQRVFSIVRDAREAGTRQVESAISKGIPLRGFEVDNATREVIVNAGYGDQFVHRTGHSIGQEIHGNGANMDNLETHDDRLVIPWSCFSIEPGIYLPHFGVRSEIDIFVDENSARVTGEKQDSLVLIG